MTFERGQYRAHLARDADDLRQAQALRALCFGLSTQLDQDRFDTRCVHLLVRHVASDQLVGCVRLLTLQGADIESSYSAQFYDLTALQAFEGPLIEVGRFCLKPDLRDPDVLRLVWGAMTALVDQAKATLLFGCTSFSGTSPARYADTFTFLHQRHKAPPQWQPRPRGQNSVSLAFKQEADTKTALRDMPPLLRSYLVMGGWVSDHAVVDPQMGTLHVFTAVDVAQIPPNRKKLLRALY